MNQNGPLTLSQTTNFKLFQTEQSADNNFKFENSRKFSNWVENTVGKGEIARYKQFLFFPQCFQKACFPGASKGVIVWEWVNMQKISWKQKFRPMPTARVSMGKILFANALSPLLNRVLLFYLNISYSYTDTREISRICSVLIYTSHSLSNQNDPIS